MKLKKFLEEIKSQKYMGIFICVFFIFIYHIYRKMSSCKKSIENMSNLNNKQITEIINRFYMSNDFIRSMKNINQKIEIDGIQINGNIIVSNNIKAEGEISTKKTSLTDIEIKIDNLETTRNTLKKYVNPHWNHEKYKRSGAWNENDKSTLPSGSIFKEIIFDSGSPNLKEMKQDVWYWIFAAHYGIQFIWGFYLIKTGENKVRLYLYNNNRRMINEWTDDNYLDRVNLIDCNVLITDNLPQDRNNFGTPIIFKVLKDPKEVIYRGATQFKKAIDPPEVRALVIDMYDNFQGKLGLNFYSNNNYLGSRGLKSANKKLCQFGQDDIPFNLTFFEGWHNKSKLPFKKLDTEIPWTNYAWESAYKLYKSSNRMPSVKFQ